MTLRLRVTAALVPQVQPKGLLLSTDVKALPYTRIHEQLSSEK